MRSSILTGSITVSSWSTFSLNKWWYPFSCMKHGILCQSNCRLIITMQRNCIACGLMQILQLHKPHALLSYCRCSPVLDLCSRQWYYWLSLATPLNSCRAKTESISSYWSLNVMVTRIINIWSPHIPHLLCIKGHGRVYLWHTWEFNSPYLRLLWLLYVAAHNSNHESDVWPCHSQIDNTFNQLSVHSGIF